MRKKLDTHFPAGVVNEFNIPKGENTEDEKYKFHWLYTIGLLAIIFSYGVLITALKSRIARSWLYGSGMIRSLITDYGVPLIIVVWTVLSYVVLSKLFSSVQRRLYCPFPWEAESLYHWGVMKDMVKVPPGYIFASFIPAVMIALLLSQCSFTASTTEGIQSEKYVRLPLRYPLAGNHAIDYRILISNVFFFQKCLLLIIQASYINSNRFTLPFFPNIGLWITRTSSKCT